MHEFSLAEALLDLTMRKVTADLTVRSVSVRAGPMRGIDPEAMRWAWGAVAQTKLPGAQLQLELLPWNMRCSECGRAWQSDDSLQACRCGSQRVYPSGDDEFTLVSIQVDDPPESPPASQN